MEIVGRFQTGIQAMELKSTHNIIDSISTVAIIYNMNWSIYIVAAAKF
ncbi:Uncharacterised protein [Bacteroides eggerthii]|uniref:Uncharacterized protein n=1 Tax=Bacteroides eggerthii TaxID=28111 RepID=A0A380ZJV8_9BACE|nr:hypothetical protein [Bacteroides eggerthii]SUV47243.1 Uncharacterised protein [Bacteroides eggerthii]